MTLQGRSDGVRLPRFLARCPVKVNNRKLKMEKSKAEDSLGEQKRYPSIVKVEEPMVDSNGLETCSMTTRPCTSRTVR